MCRYETGFRLPLCKLSHIEAACETKPPLLGQAALFFGYEYFKCSELERQLSVLNIGVCSANLIQFKNSPQDQFEASFRTAHGNARTTCVSRFPGFSSIFRRVVIPKGFISKGHYFENIYPQGSLRLKYIKIFGIMTLHNKNLSEL